MFISLTHVNDISILKCHLFIMSWVIFYGGGWCKMIAEEPGTDLNTQDDLEVTEATQNAEQCQLEVKWNVNLTFTQF